MPRQWKAGAKVRRDSQQIVKFLMPKKPNRQILNVENPGFCPNRQILNAQNRRFGPQSQIFLQTLTPSTDQSVGPRTTLPSERARLR
jgi:hypothetical protein